MSEIQDKIADLIIDNIHDMDGDMDDCQRLSMKVIDLLKSEGYENTTLAYTREVEVKCDECKGGWVVYHNSKIHCMGCPNETAETCPPNIKKISGACCIHCHKCKGTGKRTVTETLGYKCGECTAGPGKIFSKRTKFNPYPENREGCPTCSGTGFIPVTRKQVLNGEVEYVLDDCVGILTSHECDIAKVNGDCNNYNQCQRIWPYYKGLPCEWRVIG